MSLKYKLKNDKDIKTYIYFNTNKGKDTDDIKLLLSQDKNITIYPNSEDLSVDVNNSYKNVTEYINRIINKTEFLCKDLNPTYILESLESVDAIMIIGSSMDILPNGNIYGVALIDFNELYNSIYIDIICSHIGIKGAGDILIKTLEYISRKLFMTRIYLNSVARAIPFYEKYGFIKKDSSCINMCLMIKTIDTKIGGKKSRTNKNKYKKSKNMKKTKKMKKSKNMKKNKTYKKLSLCNK
jgi:hypothetical protein